MKRASLWALSVTAAACGSSEPSPSPDKQDGGDCPFAYDVPRASPEAERIGLEMLGKDGPLRLSDALYARVARDVALIRAAEAQLADQEHIGLWVPNRVIVGIAAGHTIDDLAEPNTCYQAVPSLLFDIWYRLDLPGWLNAPALAALYAVLPAVAFAGEDGIVGQENYWTPEDLGGGAWRWLVDDGFYDCFDGCDCHTYYRFDVDQAGTVTLLERWQEGMPYCVFP